MKPRELFSAVLRQWGCAIDVDDNPVAAARFLKNVPGAGTLVVDAKGQMYVEMECESIYDASVQVLIALSELTVESLTHNRDLLRAVRPEMFVWVPHRQDVTETNDAERVINQIKESM